jgi:hypothetical protein
LAVGIEVDGFGQPLIDAGDVARIREKGIGPSEGGTDDPAVVGRVETAGDEAVSAAFDEGAEVGGGGGEGGTLAGAKEGVGGTYDLDDERRIGVGVEVGRVVVDGAVGVLGGEQVGEGAAEGLDQLGRVEIF